MRAVLQPARASEAQDRCCMIQGATGGHIELFETSGMALRDRLIHNAFFEQPLERTVTIVLGELAGVVQTRARG